MKIVLINILPHFNQTHIHMISCISCYWKQKTLFHFYTKQAHGFPFYFFLTNNMLLLPYRQLGYVSILFNGHLCWIYLSEKSFYALNFTLNLLVLCLWKRLWQKFGKEFQELSFFFYNLKWEGVLINLCRHDFCYWGAGSNGSSKWLLNVFGLGT